MASKYSEEVLEGLRTAFPNANIIFKAVDVSSAAQVAKAVTNAEQQLGPITKMLCFAGLVGCFPSMETSPDEFRRVQDINIYRYIRTALSSAPKLSSSK